MDKNKRNTKTKQMVFNVLEQASSALCHEEIEQRLTEKIDRVTIYRILNGFCEDGKIHKITAEDGKTYFSLCHNCIAGHHHDNHAHFRCTDCNIVTCLDEPLATQQVPEGYRVSSVSTFLTGVCSRCAHTTAALCLALCCFALPALSQVADSVHYIPELTVSGYSSRLQGENVANVEKLDLRKTLFQGISLSEKLTNVAGIDNFSTGTGIGKPVIRGLSGNRIAVFAQGVRLENQQWGDEHGLGLDDNGYEQVEIIKGPSSLLYGSDALGGVLYFVGERYADNNNIETAVNSEFHSNTSGWRNTGKLKMSQNNLHFNLFGGYTAHRDYADGFNDRVPNSRFNTGDIKSTIAFTNEKISTALKYSYLNEKYGLTENEDTSTKGHRPEIPYQNLATHIIGWENTLFFDNNSRLKFDLGYVFNKRQEFEEEETPELQMNLGTMLYNARWYSQRRERWEFVAGSQGMYQTNRNHGEEMLVPNAETFDIGAFAMANYYYGEKMFWQTGIRFDNRNISTVEVENFKPLHKNFPSFNLSTGIFLPIVKDINKTLSLRTNLSTGFRAPNMFELLSDGVHEGTNRYEIGNSALKTENSYQADASLNYRTLHFQAFISPYFNYIRDFIYIQPTGEIIDDINVYNYLQTNAFLYGGETGFHLHPHPLDWLHIEGSYANTFGRDTEKNYLPLMPSQKLKSNVSITFANKKILKKYSIYLQNLYSFSQNALAEEETATPTYNVMNVGLNFEFKFGKQQATLNFSANNLLNEKYFDHLSRYKNEGIYNEGRNFVVKVGWMQ
ncbi:MAG: TonB-dependent receptor [Dysgonamonadaceae bacterium]|jgi:iron complex outermembrane receptor protein|nr:TonB-dependent receptor [Dysgonamonadaceae bacterium]